jgi:two-component system chemotaxis sensor kinase CheA
MNQGEKNVLLKRLLPMFKIEAEERLRDMSSRLLELEKTPAGENQEVIIETIFREMHSLKGAARAVKMEEIEAICQSLENILAALKRREIKLSSRLFDMLHHAVDTLGYLLSSPSEKKQAVSLALRQQLDSLEACGCEKETEEGNLFQAPPIELPPPAVPGPPPKDDLHQIGEISVEGPGPQAEAMPPPVVQLALNKPFLSETVRISTKKLDNLLLQAEELISEKLAASARVAELQDVKTMLNLWEKEWVKIYPEVRKLRQLLAKEAKQGELGQNGLKCAKLQDFFDWNESAIRLLNKKVKKLVKVAEHDQRSLGGRVGNLLEDVKKTIMFPFASLLETLPKMVRDLSRIRGN